MLSVTATPTYLYTVDRHALTSKSQSLSAHSQSAHSAAAMHCHCHAQSVTDSKLSTFKSHTTLVSHLSSMDQLYTLSSHIHVPQRYPSVHHPYLTPIHTQAARS